MNKQDRDNLYNEYWKLKSDIERNMYNKNHLYKEYQQRQLKINIVIFCVCNFLLGIVLALFLTK